MSPTCDSTRQKPLPAGCTGLAAVAWTCPVEGRQVKLCLPCDRTWKEKAKEDAGIRFRCPFCASQYYASREASPRGHLTGMVTVNSRPYTGPLADAIDRAMLAEGILADVRMRVLTRLAGDDDSYIAQLLRSVSGAAV